MKSWISSIYECRLCRTGLTWSDLNLPCIILYSLRAACCWSSVRSCCDKQEVKCHASLNLSRLRYGCQCCTLAVDQHCHASAPGRSILGKYLNAHLKFMVYGHKHGHIHTSAQCSSTSVGLAQARPTDCWTGLLDLICSYYTTSIQSNVVNLVTVNALHLSTAC